MHVHNNRSRRAARIRAVITSLTAFKKNRCTRAHKNTALTMKIYRRPCLDSHPLSLCNTLIARHPEDVRFLTLKSRIVSPFAELRRIITTTRPSSVVTTDNRFPELRSPPPGGVDVEVISSPRTPSTTPRPNTPGANKLVKMTGFSYLFPQKPVTDSITVKVRSNLSQTHFTKFISRKASTLTLDL